MRKLKLDLDALRVDSFGTAAQGEARGTVRGASATYGAECQTWEYAWCGMQTVEYESCGGCTGTGGSGGNPTAGHTCLYASCDGYTC